MSNNSTIKTFILILQKFKILILWHKQIHHTHFLIYASLLYEYSSPFLIIKYVTQIILSKFDIKLILAEVVFWKSRSLVKQ